MNKKVGVGATSILLISLALGKIFISDQKEHIEAENSKLMAGIRKAFLIKQQRARFSIDSLLNEQGKIYLYSNDSKAELKWAPNIDDYSYTTARAMVADAVLAEKFVRKKDSLGFLLLLKVGEKSVYPVNKGIFLDRGGKKKEIWFFASNRDERKHADSVKTNLAIDDFYSNWGVGFNDVKQVNLEFLSNAPTLGCMFLAKNVKSFRFYMVGFEKDNNKAGIDSTDFVKVSKVFNNLLKKEGVKTADFKIKYF